MQSRRAGAVAVQMVLEPDIAGYSVVSRMTKPWSASGWFEGRRMSALTAWLVSAPARTAIISSWSVGLSTVLATAE